MVGFRQFLLALLFAPLFLTTAAFAADLSEVFKQALTEDPVPGSVEFERYALQGDRQSATGSGRTN